MITGMHLIRSPPKLETPHDGDKTRQHDTKTINRTPAREQVRGALIVACEWEARSICANDIHLRLNICIDSRRYMGNMAGVGTPCGTPCGGRRHNEIPPASSEVDEAQAIIKERLDDLNRS